jgi:hypothetical protein
MGDAELLACPTALSRNFVSDRLSLFVFKKEDLNTKGTKVFTKDAKEFASLRPS